MRRGLARISRTRVGVYVGVQRDPGARNPPRRIQPENIDDAPQTVDCPWVVWRGWHRSIGRIVESMDLELTATRFGPVVHVTVRQQ